MSPAEAVTSEALGIPSVDGRRARRDRNRERVVDALLELYREGDIAPPISTVAQRSGISHRSVFRYFEDLDQLCRVAIERHSASVAHLIRIERAGEGTLAERIDSLVANRSDLYEAVAPIARVTAMRAPLQPVLRERIREDRARLDEQVVRQFAPELDSMPEPNRTRVAAAAKILCSIEAFEMMRHQRGLSAGDARQVAVEALGRLFSDQEIEQ